VYLSPVQYTQLALTQQLISAYCIHYTGKKQIAILNSTHVHVSSIYLFSFFYPPSLSSLFCIYLFQYYGIKTELTLQYFCEQVNKKEGRKKNRLTLDQVADGPKG
jgi:hypothetical protein